MRYYKNFMADVVVRIDDNGDRFIKSLRTPQQEFKVLNQEDLGAFGGYDEGKFYILEPITEQEYCDFHKWHFGYCGEIVYKPTHKQNESGFYEAEEIAYHAHCNQVDRAGKPYIYHLARVANKCKTDDEKIVALLHDVIEDSDVTAEDLYKRGFSPIIVEAVLSVTRNEGESYEDFIKRVALNPIGRVVKLYDLEDNLDIKRLTCLTEEDLPRLNKYLDAYRFLNRPNEECL